MGMGEVNCPHDLMIGHLKGGKCGPPLFEYVNERAPPQRLDTLAGKGFFTDVKKLARGVSKIYINK